MHGDSMFIFDVEGQEWGMKPMNCPGKLLFSQLVSQSISQSVGNLMHLTTLYAQILTIHLSFHCPISLSVLVCRSLLDVRAPPALLS